MKSQWVVMDYKEGMLKKITSLTQIYYGDIEIASERFLNWQYFENPTGNSIMKLAVKENEVIGQYIVIPIRFNVSGSVVIGSLSLNTLVHPQHHGKGIFKILAKEVYKYCQDKDVVFTYGFPNQNSFHGFTKSLGFRYLEVPLLIRLINPVKLLKSKLFNIKSEMYECTDNFNNNTFSDGINIANVNRFGSEFDVFWELICNNSPVMVIRNSEYLNWRYIDIPYRRYHVLKAECDGRICGYIVLRETSVKNIRCGMIVDFIVEKTQVGEQVGDNLIRSALKHFKEANVSISGALMMKHTLEFNILKRNGFITCPKWFLPQPFPLILKLHQKHDKDNIIEDFNNWFVTMGDYDVI
ncbi:GNAT family N-acetyltransferase [Desulfotruncus alcoholivorax]|uniref:GNAT family N-acetyltransferase n=1 Tax=Desulfotruncus alcoholivorax TaxID=265477 RepID=UPI000402E257|nr:GNAT family N-acetyltransferase [Desulfotruncus alcoholivorax]